MMGLEAYYHTLGIDYFFVSIQRPKKKGACAPFLS